MEAYFAAKETLFRQARVGILNGDDAYARRLPLRGLPVGVWYVCRVYGRTADSAPEVLPGTNASVAAAAVLALGIAPRQIREALDGFPGVPGRLERVPTGGAPFSVFIDYAHTPDALERLQEALARLRSDRAAAMDARDAAVHRLHTNRAALDALRPGGVLAAVLYSGKVIGDAEKQAALAFFRSLPLTKYTGA